MQFAIIGHDFKDESALARRMSVREEHLRNADKLFKEGKLLFASALLDDEGNMNGSIMFAEFPSEDDLKKEWLDNEVYITGKVWEKVTIRNAKVAKHD